MADEATETFRNVILQAGHRALAIATWVLGAIVLFMIWDRPLTIERYLPLVMFALSAVAALLGLAIYFVSEDLAQTRAEARHLVVVGAIFSAIALGLHLAAHLIAKASS